MLYFLRPCSKSPGAKWPGQPVGAGGSAPAHKYSRNWGPAGFKAALNPVGCAGPRAASNSTEASCDALGRGQRVACVADAAQAGRWSLDLHALPAGLYIVRLATEGGTFSQRIAK